QYLINKRSFSTKPRPAYINKNRAFKDDTHVKCTSADIFRVQPPLGFIKPGETATIRMWFQVKIPEGHRHYFAIYHVKSPEGKTTVKPDGTLAHFIFFRIAAVFEKPSAATPEKK
ncbi:unnamed protein product, partial [Heligmosomoides polygyrus]|uniref:MSP domain-containing protein n=1 Tax=Heligmosomoides polygyrus TaxID=6339 RepID=A0A183FB31_HELPZ